jgi:hypothetical protein
LLLFFVDAAEGLQDSTIAYTCHNPYNNSGDGTF